ncbi:Transmembrane secretion effector [Thermomonospora echinospora]|uniref:Transmembrane secretion effector n=1 Tax=Thermomonospora echinospora TaxID=1992 RepID=A0A1H6CSJ6_9ACTN|nr:transcriptional repressor [Thermomonospora echinospora]SEG75990.1 Transmembrane secretion effector [Thermomonospora echinospora]
MRRCGWALARLRAAGHRRTRSRVLLLNVLAGADGHLTVEAIHRRAAVSGRLDLSTVYRTLAVFERLQLVHTLEIGGRITYGLADHPHAHALAARRPPVRVVVLTGTVLTFLTMAWESTLVLLATGPMGVSDAGYGLMLAIGAIGGVLGAAVTPLLTRRFPQRALQIGALAATAAIDLTLALFPTPATAALAWGGTGFAFTVWNVLSVSLRQRLVPPDLLGRVNGANRAFSMTAVPAGALAGASSPTPSACTPRPGSAASPSPP